MIRRPPLAVAVQYRRWEARSSPTSGHRWEWRGGAARHRVAHPPPLASAQGRQPRVLHMIPVTQGIDGEKAVTTCTRRRWWCRRLAVAVPPRPLRKDESRAGGMAAAQLGSMVSWHGRTGSARIRRLVPRQGRLRPDPSPMLGGVARGGGVGSAMAESAPSVGGGAGGRCEAQRVVGRGYGAVVPPDGRCGRVGTGSRRKVEARERERSRGLLG